MAGATVLVSTAEFLAKQEIHIWNQHAKCNSLLQARPTIPQAVQAENLRRLELVQDLALCEDTPDAKMYWIGQVMEVWDWVSLCFWEHEQTQQAHAAPTGARGQQT